MNILITGADGFLGNRLAQRLEGQGRQVWRTGLVAPDDAQGRRRGFNFDDSQHAIQTMLRQIDTVVHLAWNSTPSVSNQRPLADLACNVMGTVKLFEACIKAGVRRIVFASSGGQVYGDVDSDAINESTLTNPKSAYGIGKLSCEKYLSLFSHLHGIGGLSLRIANLYGPGQVMREGFGVIPTVLNRLKLNDRVQIYGDGSVTRDFVYIDDVVDAFVLAIDSHAQGVLNVSSGRGVSVARIVELLEQATGLTGRREFLPARLSDPQAVVLSNRSALEVLGWAPRVTFEDGLAATVRLAVDNSPRSTTLAKPDC